MKMPISKREFLISSALGFLFLSGCNSNPGESTNSESDKITNSESEKGANIALTNSSDESTQITITITDRGNEETVLRDSYRVVATDDARFVEGVVTTTGSYDIEATIENSGASTKGVWHIPSDANPENYTIWIGLSSDGSLTLFGDGI